MTAWQIHRANMLTIKSAWDFTRTATLLYAMSFATIDAMTEVPGDTEALFFVPIGYFLCAVSVTARGHFRQEKGDVN